MSWYTFRRKAARVVLLDTAGAVLLLRANDPADRSKPPWWEIPGGGIDGGETSEAAARRELREETGLSDGIRLGPCVWVQHAEFDFGGYHFDQEEFIHVAWCDPVPSGPRAPAQTQRDPVAAGSDAMWMPEGLEPLEAMAFQGMRWWDLDQLLGSPEPVLPVRLRDFLPDLVAGDLPDEPIDIGTPSAGH